MNLVDAPFHTHLQISEIQAQGEERVILEQLGLGIGEIIQKAHQSPLGDPLALKIGEQLFSLRKEHARKILVKRYE